jgi:hypothetical protein
VKVYVLSQSDGEYSDWHIVGIFSTMEKANECKGMFGYENDIEEHELDPNAIEEVMEKCRRGGKPFFVVMDKDGVVYDLEQRKIGYDEVRHYFTFRYPSKTVILVNYMLARSKEEAVKITNDLRARLIAENLWGVDK